MTTLESSECLPGKLRIPHDGTYVTITVYISLEAFRYPSRMRTSKHVHMCTSSWKSQDNHGKSTQTATYTSAVALVN